MDFAGGGGCAYYNGTSRTASEDTKKTHESLRTGQLIISANVRTGHLENTGSKPVSLHRTTLSLYTSAKTEKYRNKKSDKN